MAISRLIREYPKVRVLSASAAIANERQTVTIEIKVKSEDGEDEERSVIVMVWNVKYDQILIGGRGSRSAEDGRSSKWGSKTIELGVWVCVESHIGAASL